MELANALPDEVWLQIFYSLPASSMLSIMLTSHRFYQLANDNSVWLNIINHWFICCDPSEIEKLKIIKKEHVKSTFQSMLSTWQKFQSFIHGDVPIFIGNCHILLQVQCNCNGYHRYFVKVPNFIPKTWLLTFRSLIENAIPYHGITFYNKIINHLETKKSMVKSVLCDHIPNRYPPFNADFDGDEMNIVTPQSAAKPTFPIKNKHIVKNHSVKNLKRMNQFKKKQFNKKNYR